MTRKKGKYFTASDLSCAYDQIPLSPETQKLTSFVKRGKQYTNHFGFYGLFGLTHWSSPMMAINNEPLIKKKKAITYLDDSLLQAKTKAEMFTNFINSFAKEASKLRLTKFTFSWEKMKFLGHAIKDQGIQSVAKRMEDLQKPKSPESEWDVMKVLWCLGFYSCYIKNLHVDSQPF